MFNDPNYIFGPFLAINLCYFSQFAFLTDLVKLSLTKLTEMT